MCNDEIIEEEDVLEEPLLRNSILRLIEEKRIEFPFSQTHSHNETAEYMYEVYCEAINDCIREIKASYPSPLYKPLLRILTERLENMKIK